MNLKCFFAWKQEFNRLIGTIWPKLFKWLSKVILPYSLGAGSRDGFSNVFPSEAYLLVSRICFSRMEGVGLFNAPGLLLYDLENVTFVA